MVSLYNVDALHLPVLDVSPNSALETQPRLTVPLLAGAARLLHLLELSNLASTECKAYGRTQWDVIFNFNKHFQDHPLVESQIHQLVL